VGATFPRHAFVVTAGGDALMLRHAEKWLGVVVGGIMWFKKHPGSGVDNDYGIAAGQRFRAKGATAILWEVEAVYRHPWEPMPHVRLRRVGMPSDAKTIAIVALRDEHFFAPVSAPSEA
jgi:hypothetical protein